MEAKGIYVMDSTAGAEGGTGQMTEERSSTEDPLGALAELHAQTKSEPAAQQNVVNQRHCGKSQGKGKKLLLGNRSGLPCGPGG